MLLGVPNFKSLGVFFLENPVDTIEIDNSGGFRNLLNSHYGS